jgi:hypothetical protein
LKQARSRRQRRPRRSRRRRNQRRRQKPDNLALITFDSNVWYDRFMLHVFL